jgi:NADPH:quinone reductase-like Zn-dependent oxidoreductase
MRAVVYDRYGPPEVLQIEELPEPTPKEGEIRVRIKAVAVTRGDCATRSANRNSGLAISFVSRAIFGVRAPRQRILGTDFAGVVDALGPRVTNFNVGDEVFGRPAGLNFGAYADYLTASATTARIVTKPAALTFEQAAACTDGGLYALIPLRAAHLKKGESVLVYGASGAIGTAGVQLARHFGADVTAVTETKNVELVTLLGADRVIDYTKEDFTKNGKTYDAIFDAVGKLSFSRCVRSLKPHGRFLPTDGASNMLRVLTTSRFTDKRVVFEIPPRLTKKDVEFVKQLIERGEFRPVIDRTYPLEQVVDAHRYVETERKVGNVVLTL